MHNGRNENAHKHAQDGVREHCEDVCKCRHIRKRLYRSAHHFHAEHKQRKAHKAGADIVLLVALAE